MSKDSFTQMPATAVARVYGISPRAVRLWHSRDGCPRSVDKSFDLRKVVAWREQRLEKKLEEQAEGGGHSRELERGRKIRADLLALEFDQRVGDLIPREVAEAAQVELAIFLRDTLLQLPGRVAPLLCGLELVEVRARLRGFVQESLERMVADSSDDVEKSA